MSKAQLSIAVLAAGILISGSLIHAQPTLGNASVKLEKDPATELFTLTISDPQGIKEFSLKPPGRPRYAGELPRCPRTFQSKNISFQDPADFDPAMAAVIIDCQDNSDNLKIPPPAENGIAIGARPAPPKPAEEEEAPRPKVEFTGPIAELGNCDSEQSCRAHCESPDNIGACLAFAEKNNLLSEAELAKARKFENLVREGGPGGCKTEAECATYCEDPANLKVCLDFAEANDLISPEELTLARRLLPLIQAGQTPGGCKSKAECEVFCSQKANLESCLVFAEANDILPPEELAEAKKFLPLIKAGETPGGCASKDECETYCSAEGHFEECLVFGEKTGFISKEEAEAIRKAGGKGPGGCRSREQCEAFCNDPAHLEECIDFGLKAGLIKPEEAELARKVGGQGPGNCRSEADCRAYCEDPSHTEECIEFGLKAGVIKPEEAEIIRKSGGVFPGGCRSIEDCTAYCTQEEHQAECQAFAEQVGIELPDEGGGGGFTPPGGLTAPAPTSIPSEGAATGFHPCRSDQECRSYCSSSPNNCREFWGIGMPNGPGALPGVPVDLPAGAAVVTVKRSETGGYLFRFMSQRKMNDFFIMTVSDYLASRRNQPHGGGIYCANTFQDVVKNFSADSFPIRVTIGFCDGGKSLGATVTPNNDFYFTEAQAFSVPGYAASQSVDNCVLSTPDGRAMLSDWQGGRNLTLETREIVRMCVLRSQGVQNPFEVAVPAAAAVPVPSTQQIPEFKVDCSLFSAAPSCSFVGSPDSQAYQLCKQCFPDR